MKSFPMFLRTSGRRVVICGGGEQAAQKARLMLKTDAQIVLAAPALEPELQAMVTAGRATHVADPVTADLFRGALMGFICTGDSDLDAALHAMAQSARCPVNVVDRPDLCDLITPSIVDRDPVVVAIGTEGTAPVLARRIKTRIEESLIPSLGGFAALAGRLRPAVAEHVPHHGRRAFWAWVFGAAPRDAWARGAEREAARMMKQAIAAGGAPDQMATGCVTLVGAGPGARDLLTLRAVERLQEADMIFHDGRGDRDVLELARRDAERVISDSPDWPQDRIAKRLVSEARRGRRVVCLSAGNPANTTHRLAVETAAAQHGIVVEIVPGLPCDDAQNNGARRA